MYRSWNIKVGEKNYDSLKDSIIRDIFKPNITWKYLPNLSGHNVAQILLHSLHLLPKAAAVA